MFFKKKEVKPVITEWTLKSTPDASFEDWLPKADDGFYIELEIAVTEVKMLHRGGGDLFTFVVTTPDFLLKDFNGQLEKQTDGVIIPRGYLLVKNYSPDAIKTRVQSLINSRRYASWDEFTNYLSRYAYYEFENYITS